MMTIFSFILPFFNYFLIRSSWSSALIILYPFVKSYVTKHLTKDFQQWKNTCMICKYIACFLQYIHMDVSSHIGAFARSFCQLSTTQNHNVARVKMDMAGHASNSSGSTTSMSIGVLKIRLMATVFVVMSYSGRVKRQVSVLGESIIHGIKYHEYVMPGTHLIRITTRLESDAARKYTLAYSLYSSPVVCSCWITNWAFLLLIPLSMLRIILVAFVSPLSVDDFSASSPTFTTVFSICSGVAPGYHTMGLRLQDQTKIFLTECRRKKYGSMFAYVKFPGEGGKRWWKVENSLEFFRTSTPPNCQRVRSHLVILQRGWR